MGKDAPGDGGAGLEMIIESESPTGGTEHRQRGDRESIEELMRICRRAHIKVRILCMGKAVVALRHNSLKTSLSW